MAIHELAHRSAPNVVPATDVPAVVAGANRRIRKRRASDVEQAGLARQNQAFLATVAHELRSPLQSLRFARALLGRISPPRSSIETSALAVIDRELGHLSRLVDDLLDVSRITHGKVGMRRVRLSLEHVVAGAVHSMRQFAEESGVRFDVAFAEGTGLVDADADRLSQVFANLLHNSVKYSDNGGEVHVRVESAGLRHVAVSVRDHGAGIAPELLESVFDLFTQDTVTSAPRHGGLGIGLSVVRSLVELHGGTVTARSEGRGTGSTFIVTLPCAARGSRARAPGIRDEAGSR